MHAQAVGGDDRPASLTPSVRPSMPWRVQEVVALPVYRLLVRFVDGLSGIVDVSVLAASPEANAFARLRDRTAFEQV